MERYLMYLRKSRMDTDFDDVSVEETLNRHRRILESFCKERRLNVVDVLEEVVSGESLSSRPKMLRLLELVNTGMYAGVICIDIERLSRGSSLESGYIMQVLQTNNCKIITPSKIYDLQNESDEQFTDMKFMFSRYELKTITKRLVRGRNQSASEGKFLGSVAPYGYRIYKLAGVKGNSLKIESSEAKIVQMIFDMYGKQGIGYNTIAYQLNEMHIPSQTGTWGQTSITNILNNEVYLGMIRWKHEPTKRIVKDGMLTKKRVVSKDYELYEGLHEPIISQEQWDMVKSKQQERNHSSVNSNRQLTNPFATILFCEKCGAVMKRNVPSKKQKTSPWYRCPTRGCDCRAIKCDFAEESILKAMKEWLAEYTVNIEAEKTIQTDPVETALKVVREQLTEIQLQQDKICEYLEKGVYTVEMFTKRNDTLTREMRKLQASEADLLKKQSSQSDIKNAEAEIIPTTQRIWYGFVLTMPTEQIGRAITDIRSMGGELDAPESGGPLSTLKGRVPAAEVRDYAETVAAYTQGRGRLQLTLQGYAPCHNTEAVVAEIGYDPEADLENTADSVFCGHGAGFTVKWNEVRDYMHLESGLKEEKGPQIITRNVRVDDKELEKIMEREFGPIRRPLYNVKAENRPATEEITIRAPKQKYIIVDGYNIIFAWETLAAQARADLDAARRQLCDLLSSYAGFTKCRLVVVFDGYKQKGNPGEKSQFHNIQVVYTREGETADAYIEALAGEIGNNYAVRVASSDGLVQLSSFRSGVLRMSARELLAEVEEARREMGQHFHK